MARIHKDWIAAFLKYAYGEAPTRMYFWVGASTLAGALRRRCWIQMGHFSWFPNMYVVLTAPPGIVSKSTTADIGMDLLRKVPGIHFGPSVCTWQSLITEITKAGEYFEYAGTQYPMSAVTIVSSEFGNLVNPADKDMIDMLVHLWDGKSFTKSTKMSGTDEVINPWVNAIACTTPEWIAQNLPEYMIGGGFTSRCLFVYADKKERYVAYPFMEMPENTMSLEGSLVADLEHISQLSGPFTLTPDAIAWGRAWYERHYTKDILTIDSARFGGYAARKQTHMHKLAMLLSASARDDMLITQEDLQTAYTMVTDLESEMHFVFDKVGTSKEAFYQQRIAEYVRIRKKVPYTELYRVFSKHFPRSGEFEEITTTLQKGGLIAAVANGADYYILWTGPSVSGEGEAGYSAPSAPEPASPDPA